MNTALKNIKFKYQLLLLLALPALAIVLLSGEKLSQSLGQLSHIRHAQEAAQEISASTDIVQLLQQERGLSTRAVGSTDRNEPLAAKRKQSDARIADFERFLVSIRGNSRSIDHPRDRGPLRASLERIHDIRIAIDSEDAQALEGFRAYSDVIEAVIRHAKRCGAESELGSIAPELTRQQERLQRLLKIVDYAAQERGLINIILVSGLIRPALFQWVSTVNWMQNKLIHAYDDDRGPGDSIVLSTALNQPEFLLLETTRQAVIQKTRRDELLNNINRITGYGGLIHNFKNYLIRKDGRNRADFTQQHGELVRLFERYKRTTNLTENERAAIDSLERTFNIYRQRLAIIDEVKGKIPELAQSTRDLDLHLVVDDSPALEALRNLQYGSDFIAPDLWFQLATRRMEILEKTRETGYREYTVGLARLERAAFKSAVITALLIFGVLFITATISKSIFNRLVGGIQSVALQMKRALDTGSLIDESLIGKDELGIMATSLNDLIRERTVINQELDESRVQLEELLEQKSHDYDRQQHIIEGVIQTSQDGIITIDSTGTVLDFNPAAEELFLYTADEAIGRDICDLIIPENMRDAHRQGLLRATALPEGAAVRQRYEVPAMRADDTHLTIELALGRIVVDGSVLFTAFLRDITDRLQHQQELEKAKESAEIANQAKSEFLANMSHELRTPMHAILSFSDMGLRRHRTISHEKLHKYFSTINLSGSRLLKLLNELLDLAKIEAKMMSYDFRVCDLDGIAREAIAEYDGLLQQKNLKVVFLPVEFPARVAVDNEKVGRVIKNLLSNAMKFTPEHRTIIVSVSQEKIAAEMGEPRPALKLCVQDQGIGIPEDELKSVFDKFIQSSKSKTGAGGTGLGLAICKEIIAAHHGEIWAMNNANDDGCAFSILLPIRQPSAICSTADVLHG